MDSGRARPTPPRLAVALAALLASVVGVRGTRAQTYPAPRDRDHALDLYSGGIVGDVRVIGMGGTAVALAEGSIGTFSNAAAPAVRRAAETSLFGWELHLDAEAATDAEDFDNNGLPDTDRSSSQLATAGLILKYGPWGLGVSATMSSARLVDDDGDAATLDGVLDAHGTVAKLVLARSFGREAHTLGAGLRLGTLTMARPRPGRDFALFTVAVPTLEVGWVWRPPEGHLRIGASAAGPASPIRISEGDCDPLRCAGYLLPERVEVPWTVAAGVAYRFGPTPWNTRVETRYRDEHALLLAADLVVTGAVADGHGLEAFARHQLQPSGREVVFSAFGAELELIPGWIRIRAGTYWEPGRFADAGGRLHGTAGADVRLFEIRPFGRAFRPQLSLTGDAAPGYRHAGVSLGFWR